MEEWQEPRPVEELAEGTLERLIEGYVSFLGLLE